MKTKVRYRLMIVVGIGMAIGQIATAVFFARHQEQTILAQHETAIRKFADGVAEGLQSVMMDKTSAVPQAFAERIRRAPEVLEFRIIRNDGMEAFRDNSTIRDVNKRNGNASFFAERTGESPTRVLDRLEPSFQRAMIQKTPVFHYGADSEGNLALTVLAPLANREACQTCHDVSVPITGVVRMTTSLASAQQDILQSRYEAMLVLLLSWVGTMVLAGYLFGRVVAKPIEAVTRAMKRIAEGDLDHKAVVTSQDEIGQIAISFNKMTDELKSTYSDLRCEQDKLTTVIESASEGMVVTDATGEIVMANSATAHLIGKSIGEIVDDGFLNLVGDPDVILRCTEGGQSAEVECNDKKLQIHASVIRGSDNSVTGSVAIIRDVTEERRLERELLHISTTDALTGLFNRRFLDETLDKEFRRANRGNGANSTISIILFDVDHFKVFNDTHGHDQGDRVLQAVAGCLRETVLGFDFPCRYGGEEFVAILPGRNSAAAWELAERLRILVAETDVNGMRVHISLGVATYPDLPANSGIDLLEAADAALYRAKQAGRNRTVVAEATR